MMARKTTLASVKSRPKLLENVQRIVVPVDPLTTREAKRKGTEGDQMTEYGATSLHITAVPAAQEALNDV